MLEKDNTLSMFHLIDETCSRLKENQPVYVKAVMDITESLETILNELDDGMLDINSRIKSSYSLKEKIIRKKLYMEYNGAQEILDNLSDLIGIMIECRFIANEQQIYHALRKHFHAVNDAGFYYHPKTPGITLDLESKQPQRQKNGYEIYRIDGQYHFEGNRVNFEVQIKSLVNAFWSEIEHKVVYKNNAYIPNHGYIEEMLSAIRGNLTGIDKMLQLVNDEIQETSSHRSRSLIDINSAIAKLISDTFLAKMSESIGFTVDFKAISNLIGKYILNKYTDLPIRTAQNAFLDLIDRFNEIYDRRINWEKKLYLEDEYVDNDSFCQIFGNKLISMMNIDFEWHLFFLMLFQIESDNNNLESFVDFMGTLKNSYSDKSLYKRLYTVYDQETADKIHGQLVTFLAQALCETASVNIIDSDSEKCMEMINEVIGYVVDNFASYDEFESKLETVCSLILKKSSTIPLISAVPVYGEMIS